MCYCVVSNSLYRRVYMFVYFVGLKFSWILLVLIHDNLWSFIYIIMMFKVYLQRLAGAYPGFL